jgi:DeoR family fructose operon transcriptional repressor
MYPFERIDRLMKKLRSTGRITVAEEARLLGVSYATMHRDLDRLEKQGKIEKVRGGAILRQGLEYNSHFEIRKNKMVEEKKKIAQRAAEFVRDDTAVFLDHSSSVLFLAKELGRVNFKNLIVITNSLQVPMEFSEKPGVQVILTGGVVQEQFQALSGRIVLETLKYFNLHQIFASVGAISVDRGFMTQMPFIHEIFAEIFSRGQEVNILADNSKFYKIGTFQIAPLEAATRIFTDKSPPQSLKAKILEKGPEIIV